MKVTLAFSVYKIVTSIRVPLPIFIHWFSSCSWPFRGQYPGHVITLDQSKASISPPGYVLFLILSHRAMSVGRGPSLLQCSPCSRFDDLDKKFIGLSSKSLGGHSGPIQGWNFLHTVSPSCCMSPLSLASSLLLYPLTPCLLCHQGWIFCNNKMNKTRCTEISERALSVQKHLPANNIHLFSVAKYSLLPILPVSRHYSQKSCLSWLGQSEASIQVTWSLSANQSSVMSHNVTVKAHWCGRKKGKLFRLLALISFNFLKIAKLGPIISHKFVLFTSSCEYETNMFSKLWHYQPEMQDDA